MPQSPSPSANTLYYGDNLSILREHIADSSVDLIYLDPPFNSNASYNVLFKAPEGHQSKAQIEAFDDTWHWTDSAEVAFDEVVNNKFGNSDISTLIMALRQILKTNDMMAYLTMMAVRLLELHRALKPTGTLYLHCDPTASHYLKILLDAVFGKTQFLSEIIWKRTSSHSSARRWGPVHDTILVYAKTDGFGWNQVFEAYDDQYLERFYRNEDKNGRFRIGDLTGAGKRSGDSGKSWRGTDPTESGRHWAVPTAAIARAGINGDFESLNPQGKLDRLDELGLIYWPPKGRIPQFKRYLEVDRGVSIQDVITDIKAISSQAKERLGYPTQKPVALLERILAASSNPGDVVLDPFCGCGTTLHAAAKLDRKWIGIDITHLAIALIRRRLNEAFPEMKFNTVGVPKDADGARTLALADKYEFQKWALSMIDAQPYKGGKKGGDGGVDGYLYFKPDGKKTEKAIVSVKGGQSLNPAMLKDLIVTVDQEGAKMGIFLTLEAPTRGMITQAAAAGIYKTEYGQFPKIQIVTVAQLFQPASPIQMPWQDTSVFKKSRREPAHQPKLEL